MSPPSLPGVEHRYHELATGLRAHVAEAGPADAPALLMLHGFPQHWYIWRHVIAELAGEFRVLAMDTRGLGWSGLAPDGDYRKARLADDALALLDLLGIERCGLVGHDWGGWTGFHLALRAPERFSFFVVLGVPHPWTPPGTMLRSLPRFLYQPPIAAPFLGPRLIRKLTPRFLRAGWGDRSTWDATAADSYAERFREPDRAEAGSRYYRAFLRHEAGRGPHGRLAMPTRLLHGTRDPIGTALVHGIERHGADARLVLLEGCGHFVPEERPASVVTAIREVASKVNISR